VITALVVLILLTLLVVTEPSADAAP